MGSLRLITTSVFLLLLIFPAAPETVTYHKKSKENHEIYGFQITDREIKEKLAEFLAALQNSESSKTKALQIWFDSLIKSDLINNRTDLSDAFYFIGFHHMNNSDYQLSYKYMLESANIRENLGLKDTRYRRALLNMGTILIVQGKFREAVTNYESLIDFITEQDGENSADNILNYNNLASAYNELKMFEKAIEAALKGIESYELNKNAEGITPVELLRLYNNLGISYSRRNDYSRAKLHLSRAYEIVKDNPTIPWNWTELSQNTFSETKKRRLLEMERSARKIQRVWTRYWYYPTIEGKIRIVDQRWKECMEALADRHQ